MHLIIDGYGDDASLMADEQLIYNILDQYPATIGMHKVISPCVFRYIGKKAEDWGISGFVIIAESHISIHTFVTHRYVNIDVFSCRDFNPEKVIEDFKQFLQLNKIKTHLLRRGTEDLNLKPVTCQLHKYGALDSPI